MIAGSARAAPASTAPTATPATRAPRCLLNSLMNKSPCLARGNSEEPPDNPHALARIPSCKSRSGKRQHREICTSGQNTAAIRAGPAGMAPEPGSGGRLPGPVVDRHHLDPHGAREALEKTVDDALGGTANQGLAELYDAAVGAAEGAEVQQRAAGGIGEGDVGGALGHAEEAAPAPTGEGIALRGDDVGERQVAGEYRLHHPEADLQLQFELMLPGPVDAPAARNRG